MNEVYSVSGDVFGAILERGLVVGERNKVKVFMNSFTMNDMFFEVIGDNQDSQVFAVGAPGMRINLSRTKADEYRVMYVGYEKNEPLVAPLEAMHIEDLRQLVRTVRKMPTPDILDEDRFTNCVLQEFERAERRRDPAPRGEEVIKITITSEEEFKL